MFNLLTLHARSCRAERCPVHKCNELREQSRQMVMLLSKQSYIFNMLYDDLFFDVRRRQDNKIWMIEDVR